MIWSDESKFNLFGSDSQPYVRRKTGERYSEESTVKTVKHSDSQMVYGCCSYYSIGKMYFVDGIMNASMYNEVLQDKLVPSIEEHLSFTDTVIFQDDSASCHRA